MENKEEGVMINKKLLVSYILGPLIVIFLGSLVNLYSRVTSVENYNEINHFRLNQIEKLVSESDNKYVSRIEFNIILESLNTSIVRLENLITKLEGEDDK